MSKKLFSLLILLVLALGLAAPASMAAARGTTRTTFTYTAYSMCTPDVLDPRCDPGHLRTMPNGRSFLVGWVDVLVFIAEDPRWTVKCVATCDPFPPSSPNAQPLNGSFICTPLDETGLKGGWWEGTVNQVVHPDRWISEFTAKGYGIFDGLLSNSKVTTPDKITIIELPGYKH